MRGVPDRKIKNHALNQVGICIPKSFVTPCKPLGSDWEAPVCTWSSRSCEVANLPFEIGTLSDPAHTDPPPLMGHASGHGKYPDNWIFRDSVMAWPITKIAKAICEWAPGPYGPGPIWARARARAPPFWC